MRTFLCLAFWLISVSPVSAETKTLNGVVAVYAQVGTTWWNQWDHFRTNAEANPSVKLDYHIQGELGSEQQLIAGLRRNRVHVAGISQGLTTLVPEIGVMAIPFLFDSVDEAAFTLDNYLAIPFSDALAEKGLTVLRFTEASWTILYTTKHPVLIPSDLSGLTIRIAPNVIQKAFMESLGTDYALVQLGELIAGLETGLIHGGLANVVWVDNFMRDVVHHVTKWNAVYGYGAVLVATDWLQNATPTQQSAIHKAFLPTETARQQTRIDIKRILSHPAPTMQFHTLSKDQIAQWRRASQGAKNRILEAMGPTGAEFFDLVIEGKRAYAENLR